MPTAVACPNCQQKYSLPDNLIGKPVQCKKCNKKFQIGKPKAAAGPAAANNQANQAKRQAKTAALRQMGLDQLNDSPDLFGSAPPPTHDPLANHVVHDPGFGQATTYVAGPEEEPHQYADLFENPEVAKKKKRKSADLSKYNLEEDVIPVPVMRQPWCILLVIFGMMAALTGIIYISTYEWGKPMGFANLVLVCTVSAILNLWFLVAFFKSQPTTFEIVGFFFIPFYAFVIMFTKFQQLKSVILAIIVNWIFLIIAGILIVVTSISRY